MKSIFFILAASVATSRFLQSNEDAVTPSGATYSAGYECGECLRKGFTYCYPRSWGDEHQSSKAPDRFDRCRQGEYNTGDLSASADWLCSTAYSSRAYAKYLCNYDNNACGGADYSWTLAAGSSQTV